MLSLDVEIAVLTNVELDHHATLRLAGASCARRFARSWRGAHRAIVVWDRPELLALTRRPPGGGRHERADWPRGSRSFPTTCPSRCSMPGARAFSGAGTRCALAVPGAHNALNAIGALEAARLAGADAQRAIAGPRRLPAAPAGAFSGWARPRGAQSCTTTTPTTRPRSRPRCGRPARSRHRRLVAVFQPHLYSRTALLAREFGAALALADVVVVLDVYPGARARRGPSGRERPAGRRGRGGRGRGQAGVLAAHASPTPSRSCASCSARAMCAS